MTQSGDKRKSRRAKYFGLEWSVGGDLAHHVRLKQEAECRACCAPCSGGRAKPLADLPRHGNPPGARYVERILLGCDSCLTRPWAFWPSRATAPTRIEGSQPRHLGAAGPDRASTNVRFAVSAVRPTKDCNEGAKLTSHRANAFGFPVLDLWRRGSRWIGCGQSFRVAISMWSAMKARYSARTWSIPWLSMRLE